MGEGAYLLRQGSPREGLERFLAVQQALEQTQAWMAESGNVPRGIQDFLATKLAACLNNIGFVYQSQGDLAKALDFYNRALAIDEAIDPNSTQTARDLNNIGGVYQSQGDLAKALEFYSRALAIDEAIALNSTGTAIDLNNIGGVYQSQGDLAKALEFYSRALAINEAIDPNSTETATNLNNIGLVYRSQGDLAKALEFFSRALAIDEAIALNSTGTAIDLNSIGYIYQSQGDPAKALEFFSRALAINEAIDPNSTGTATNLNNIGYIYQSQGDPAKALEFYSRALVINEAIAPNSTETAIDLNNIGYIYQSQGDPAKALVFYDKAVAVRESLRERATDRQSRETLGSLEDTLISYWATLYIRNQRRGAGDAEKAFHTGEMLRARILTERLADQRYEPATDDEARLLAQWRTAQGRYDQALTIRQQTDRDPALSSEDRNRVRADEDAARQEQDTLWKQVEVAVPAFAALVRPATALTLPIVQQRVLDPGTLLLSYCFFEGEFVAWAVRKDQVAWLDVNTRLLSTRLRFLREDVISGSGITSLRNDVKESARTLGTLLLPPDGSPLWDGVTRVLLAPDGPLFYLPFELLPRLADLPLTYIPSATTLDEMCTRQDRMPAPGAFLGFGDPESGPMTFGDGSRSAPNRLPQARLEALRLKEKHTGAVEVYTDKDATKTRALEKMPRFRRLHFATHGGFDSDDPFASFLLLAPEDPASLDNADRLLTARELLGLRLSAELVVCSACETGLGDVKNGEGLMGLSRAFLSAGARCLVVSLWRVSDRATRIFMERFYDHLQNSTVEQALLRTRQQMRDGIWSHPYYWAGFIAYGITTDPHPAPLPADR